MFKTIRFRLLVILLSFVLVTVTTSVIVFYFFERTKNDLSKITQQVESTHVLLLKDIKATHEFFENETINPDFFKTGKSNVVRQHEKICKQIDSSLNDLYAAQRRNQFDLDDTVQSLHREFNRYKYMTADIIRQVLVRGFKDYGIEGRMRNHAHRLENYQQEIGLVNILQLRRHEKDFIIRQEEPYILKHSDLTGFIKNQVVNDKKIGTEKKVEIITTLDNYSAEFGMLVRYEKKLGLKSGAGLKKQVDNISGNIETSLAALVSYSATREQAALEVVKYTYLSIGLAFILAGVISALLISKKVSRSVTHLKDKIDEFVKSDFTVRTILPITDSTNEIDILATNFSIMEQHIVNQMNSLRQSNKDLEMLFYATSNDIRLPLLTVKELTDRAYVAVSDPMSKEYLRQINQSWENLLAIIDELGIITNIRNVEIKTEPIELETLIRSVFQEFKGFPGFDAIIFSLALNSKTKFVSSPGLLRAIFRNLLENGIKYAAKRKSFSFLKVVVNDQGGNMLSIELSDNGIGINSGHLDKIFDMFYRGTTAAPGTGLGLYIVKCSVEKLNGTIAVESVEDQGTRFRLMIPNNYTKKNIKEQIIHDQEILRLATRVSLNAL